MRLHNSVHLCSIEKPHGVQTIHIDNVPKRREDLQQYRYYKKSQYHLSLETHSHLMSCDTKVRIVKGCLIQDLQCFNKSYKLSVTQDLLEYFLGGSRSKSIELTVQLLIMLEIKPSADIDRLGPNRG